jgi:glycerol-3-phosphate cytidylyltransferase
MGLIYTGGTFDLFHAGHVEFLRRCKDFGHVTVALNTDEFIADYKGKPPVMSFQERLSVLEACKYVDRVIPNSNGADSKPSILYSQANLIVIGSDWARRDYYKQMGFTQDWLDQYGIGLAYIPYTANISSTIIKQRMTNELQRG